MLKLSPTTYFDSLLDDFGIWQHADGKFILRSEGYALDDATRGLLFTLSIGNLEQSEVLWSYIKKSKAGVGFFGFSSPDRSFLPAIASDDAIGQVVWAAGYAISRDFHSDEARALIDESMLYLDTTEHVRGYAYALLGALYVDKNIADRLFNKLFSFFEKTDEEWPWPEQKLTYGNGLIPYVFLRYGLIYKNDQAICLGRKILLFLENCCTNDRQRGPIGNDGWMTKGDKLAPTYSQQPIDTAYMIWAWVAAFQISNNLEDRKMAEAWMRWFDGENVANSKMYDPKTSKTFDGINPIGSEHSDKHGVNYHSGAESNICFLLSSYIIDRNITI